jgi:hypothetical protein
LCKKSSFKKSAQQSSMKQSPHYFLSPRSTRNLVMMMITTTRVLSTMGLIKT